MCMVINISDRVESLKNRTVTLPIFIRRAHRIIATLWLLFIAIALSLEAVGGPESPFITAPIGVLLLLLALSGTYLLVRPWVQRFRASRIQHTESDTVE